MRTSAFSALALGFGLVTFQLSACSNSADDCNATASCGATSGVSGSSNAGKSGSGNDAGASDGGGAPDGGAPTTGGSVNGGTSGTSGTSGSGGSSGMGGVGGDNNPLGCSGDIASDTACWATNEFGIFVSSDGGSDSTGDGTMEKPFASVSAGIAAAAGKNVYVCQADNKDYIEQIILNKPANEVHVYGGFECKTWTYSTTRSALVTPATENVALRIISASNTVYIENLRFTAADASGTGLDASSYGAFVTDSKSVTFKRVVLTAGAGAGGINRVVALKGDDGAVVGVAQQGQPAACGGSPGSKDGGLWPDAPVCGSRGGDGGKAVLNTDGGSGFSGIPAQNVTPENKANLGAGASTPGQPGTDGTEGASGNAGAVGVAADSAGTFDATGFTPADGHDGKPGFPGQGGGGGGASKGAPTCRGASGGAGGMGGCGGNPGKGGGGAGASVGLLSWGSSVSLLECTIIAGAAGSGGVGGKGGTAGVGSDGASGGAADPGNGIGKGGRGGAGGNGGNGGSGSGGTAGPSIAIVYSGATPSYDLADTTLSHAAKGAKGGVGGTVLTAKAPDGSDGAALDVLPVK